MIRIVIDTNVFIRYLIRPSIAIQELIEVRWLTDQVQVVTAPELVAELAKVLQRPKLQAYIQPHEAQILLDTIYRKAEIVPALKTIPSYTRDPKDDKFVACALVAAAGYLVSVDQDILVLGNLEGIQMVTPQEFLLLLDAI